MKEKLKPVIIFFIALLLLTTRFKYNIETLLSQKNRNDDDKDNLYAAGLPLPEYPKPNVILIIADDLGYADLSIHGCKDIPTPNIDSIALNGVRFSNGYVTCSVCSPSRAGFITGKYQQRFGHEYNTSPGLPLNEVTIANMFKTTGYKTGIIGKWHLGGQTKHQPQKRGFDEFFGFHAGYKTYFPYNSKYKLYRGTTTINEKEYLTDAFTREAVSFIERNKETKFFLYLSYKSVHAPLEAVEKYISRFPNISDKNRKNYAAVLTAMDDGVGTVLKTLQQNKIEDDTLIFFISDNGGPISEETPNAWCNLPLRDGKVSLYEGGIRVPFFIQWNQVLPKGKVYDNPVISLDILPTSIESAGGTVPEQVDVDGVNLIPYLVNKTTDVPHEVLYWRFGGRHAVRKGDWKLVKLTPIRGGVSSSELFDLSKDVSETTNLVSQKPAIAKELDELLTKWESTLITPTSEPKENNE